MVFEAIRKANLMIKLKKCQFCLPNIPFLGYIVGRSGLQPDPEKIRKIRELPAPKGLTELRAALGLFSYYRKFVKGFSQIAKPITTLLKKDAPYIWTNDQQESFDKLKEKLITLPILQYPDFSKEFILYTDALEVGLGAVLSQLDEHVIAYASKSMNKAEQNYPITDQECLAVVWAIRNFHHYLSSKPFTVVTDHSALKWLRTSKIPKG
jgi:hypothetical protein